MAEAFQPAPKKPLQADFAPTVNAFLVADNLKNDNLKEARKIFLDALSNFEKDGIKDTIIERELRKLKPENIKTINVAFGTNNTGKGKDATIYSVKIEVDGATKIFTLEVGKNFTELSFIKNGKIIDIVREENGEILRDKGKV